MDTDRKYDHILSLIWLVFLVFPNNQIFYFLVPVCFIILCRYQIKIESSISTTILTLFVLLFLNVLFNINETYLSSKDVSRTVVLGLIFVTFGRLKGSRILAPYIYIAIFFLIISQFASIIGFTPLVSLINNNYSGGDGEAVPSSIVGMERYGNFRLGGIYLNPNQYARYLELIMLVLFCEIKQFSKKEVVFLIIIIVFSLIATGSRTSLIVLIVAVIFYLYSSGVISLNKAFLISSFCTIIFILFIGVMGLNDARILKVDEGVDGSFGVKVDLFKSYLNSEVPFNKFLIGNASLDSFKKYTGFDIAGMDFEFGNIILVYGVLFFIFLFLLYVQVYRSLLPNYRVLYTLLLWMFSSSILMSFRMAALWLLVLGIYYKRSIINKRNS